MSRSLAYLINRFRVLADDLGTPPHWSNDELTIYANEAQVEACRRARLLQDSATPATSVINVVEGQDTYPIDERVIFIRRVKPALSTLSLGKVDIRDLDEFWPDWENMTPDLPRAWMPVDDHQIKFLPPPSADDTVTLTVIREPLNDMSLPDNGQTMAEIQNLGLSAAPTTAGAFNLRTFDLAPQVAIPDLTATVTSIPAPMTGTLNFSNELTKVTAGTTWATWSESYAGPVYFNPGATLTLTLPPLCDAIYFYVEGNDLGFKEFTFNINAGQNVFGPYLIDPIGGANGFLFFTDNIANPLVTIQITYSGSSGFGIGQFGSKQGALAIDSELPNRQADKLVDWMLFKAYSSNDAELANPKQAALAEANFESNFGPPLSARDELWITRRHGYDEYEGLE